MYKWGNAENPSNYRPVSLTSVLAKLSEKVIQEKWIRHLEENKGEKGKGKSWMRNIEEERVNK